MQNLAAVVAFKIAARVAQMWQESSSIYVPQNPQIQTCNHTEGRLIASNKIARIDIICERRIWL